MTGILGHVLVATDGSETGNRAVSFAIALARRHGSDLLLCNAVDHATAIAESSTSNGGFGLLMPLVGSLNDAAESILSGAAKCVTDAGVTATTTVLEGRSAQAIVKLAHERHVDAIVMGTQGKRGLERFFMGSTADGVLRRTDVPTFVVPPGASHAKSAFDRILVAIDDSDPSDAAAHFARDLAKAEEAHVIVCGVVATRDLAEKAATYGYDPMAMLEELRAGTSALIAAHMEQGRADNVASESVIAEGDPAENILTTADAQRAELIVVGTHGRRGLQRLFVGSVAESVVRRSMVPVAVVRASRRHVDDAHESALATSATCLYLNDRHGRRRPRSYGLRTRRPNAIDGAVLIVGDEQAALWADGDSGWPSDVGRTARRRAEAR